MAVSDYNESTNWDNERKYLENLIAGGDEKGEWAKRQMNDLNAAQQQYGGKNNTTSTNTTGTTKTTNTTGGTTGSGVGGTTGGATGGGSYNVGTDYQALINSAVASGDYASAAKYEQQRNNKIQSEGLNNYQITNYYSDFLGGNKGAATKTTVNRGGERLSAVVIGGKTYLTNDNGTFTGGKLQQGDAVSAANGTTYYYDEASGKGLTQEDYSKATKRATNTRANTDTRTGRRVETVDYVDGLGNVTRAATVDGEPVQDGFTYNYVAPGDDGYEYEVTATWSSTGGEDGKGGWTESVSDTPTFESYQAVLQKQYDEYLAQQQAVNQAAVDLSVKEIEANLENGLEDYSQSAAETYLKMLKAQQNQQLRNAAAGDLGGIGQKQYNDASAQYDAALLQIELEREAFINSCNQQIEQLKAQGRLQDAQILADWAQTKLEMYDQNYKWYQEMALQRQQIDYNQSAADREYYFNRAVGMLEKGILTEDALTALGISEADAQNYAAMLNEEASVSLAYAKAQLDNLVKKAAGTGGGGGGTPTVEPPAGNPNDIITWYSEDASGNAVPHTMFRSEAEGLVQDGWFTVDEYGNPLYYNAATGELESQEGRDRRVSGETAQANEREIGARLSTWYSKYSGIGKGNNATELYNSLSNRMSLLYNDIQAQEREVQNRRDEAARDPSATNRKWNIKVAEDQLTKMKQEYDRYAAAIEEYNSLAR